MFDRVQVFILLSDILRIGKMRVKGATVMPFRAMPASFKIFT